MKTPLQLFKHLDFSYVRTIDDNGETWYAAQDVALALGYQNTNDAIHKHCKKPKLFYHKQAPHLHICTKGSYFINLPDVYRLIMACTLPSVLKFKHWVITEVLINLHHHGKYQMPD